MVGHAQLKFVTAECSKTQIRLTGPILSFRSVISTTRVTMSSSSSFVLTNQKENSEPDLIQSNLTRRYDDREMLAVLLM